MENDTQRSFVIGDNWIYYKIYSGTKTADSILINDIKPIAESLRKENIITKWFFIRYSDPKTHIRLRFFSDNIENIGIIIKSLCPIFAKYIANDLIWKVQTDTYNRELERYGFKTIELAEDFFYADSEMIACLLLLIIEQNFDEEVRWLFGLLAIDAILSVFNFNLEQKRDFMDTLKTSFGQEFRMNRELKKQLDNKFRNERNKIELFFLLNRSDEASNGQILSIIEEYKNKISRVSEKILLYNKQKILEVEINNLISSFIHMTMNRLFKSKNRVHEMVCYDFLYRHYRSALARNNNLHSS